MVHEQVVCLMELHVVGYEIDLDSVVSIANVFICTI